MGFDVAALSHLEYVEQHERALDATRGCQERSHWRVEEDGCPFHDEMKMGCYRQTAVTQSAGFPVSDDIFAWWRDQLAIFACRELSFVVKDDPERFRDKPFLELILISDRAGFHDAQDPDQPLLERPQGELLLGPGILVDVTGLILPGPSVLLREGFGVFDQPFGPRRRMDFQEIDAADLEHKVEEALEFGDATDGQMSLEEDAVKTGQRPGDDAGELGEERAYCLHDIRFLHECS